MKTTVIIPAAGTGSRMGYQKQLISLKGKPLIIHTVEAFESHEEVDEIFISAPDCVADVIKSCGFKKVKAIVEGGADRQSSVWACLQKIADLQTNSQTDLQTDSQNILVHDGARPLITQNTISDILFWVKKGFCVSSGVKSKDTIKITDSDNIVQSTPAREHMWLVQTPQGFPAHLIADAHRKAMAEGFVGTDDAMLIEHMGIPVRMVEGDYRNIKITTPEDVPVAEAFMNI